MIQKNKEEQQEVEDQSEVLIADILILLSSRPCSYPVENITGINESIINYGVSDIFSSDIPRLERNLIMCERINTALQRFEPRLINVAVLPGEAREGMSVFIIEADTFFGAVRYRLMWDDVIGRFSLRN